MKNGITLTAILLAAAITIGSTTILAAGGRQTPDREIQTSKTAVIRNAQKPEMTEEQKAEMLAKAQEKISALLANGEITQEQYDDFLTKIEAGEMPFIGMGGKGHGLDGMNKGEMKKPEIPEMTEEEKAEKLEEIKAALAEKLANGEITQEQYDEAIAKIDNGELPFFGNGRGFGRMNKSEKPEAPEMTEEQKTEMLEKIKTELAERLANGEITQEQYDESIAKIEAGEMPILGINGRKCGFGGMNKVERPESSETSEEISENAESTPVKNSMFRSTNTNGTGMNNKSNRK